MNTHPIAAIATPSGRGGVGIIRLSGKAIHSIIIGIIGSIPEPRKATYCQFRDHDNAILDDGIALYFPAPHSFTGETVLELQGHGGQVVLDMVLNRLLQLGAVPAHAGEFSERAFLNDKLDLTQAEAIADLIDSGSEQAARSALRSLQGDFSKLVNTLLHSLIELRTYVEAALDFPDEEIDFLADDAVTQRLSSIKQQLNHLHKSAKQGNLLREGMHLVIIGLPNAGKSSLLNALAGQESAIVTDIAGTTRDILRESINIDGMPLHIIDTAGLRESNDPIEKIGIERAWQEIKKADLVIHLIDSSQPNELANQAILVRLPKTLPILTVYNKSDLITTKNNPNQQQHTLTISAKEGDGMDLLKQRLKEKMGFDGESDSTFIARRRHLHALEKTQLYVSQAEIQLIEFQAGELMAEDLRLAQEELGKITGQFTSDDLLGEIFSSFCIGK